MNDKLLVLNIISLRGGFPFWLGPLERGSTLLHCIILCSASPRAENNDKWNHTLDRQKKRPRDRDRKNVRVTKRQEKWPGTKKQKKIFESQETEKTTEGQRWVRVRIGYENSETYMWIWSGRVRVGKSNAWGVRVRKRVRVRVGYYIWVSFRVAGEKSEK